MYTCAAILAHGQTPEPRPAHSINPVVEKIVASVSEDRISATLKKLESFGTRNTMSAQDDPAHGIGAARQWIFDQFKSYSPRLQVRFDTYHVKKQGRISQDVQLSNVVAVLPGTVHPEWQFIVSGHYDSLNITVPDWVHHQATAPAPGVDDDGSGTAAVLELARVMSQYEFPKTAVFIAFAGEEQGLIGSRLYAQKARQEHQQIDAVLNNDIIGTAVAGNGRSDNGTVRLFSEAPEDGPSREVARYAERIGERYVPSMRIDLVFRADRFGRGGDHTSFNGQGYAAVRFTTANENYAHQHTPLDNFENVSTPYATRVARINAAVLASLALAPSAPITSAAVKTPAGGEVSAPLLDRGPSGYDAHLRWRDPNSDANLAGYAIVIRATTAARWQREIFVGKVNEFLLPDVSIDDVSFGVKAIDTAGNESLVSPYVMVEYAARPVQTQSQ